MTPPGWNGWLHHTVDTPPTSRRLQAPPLKTSIWATRPARPLAIRPKGSTCGETGAARRARATTRPGVPAPERRGGGAFDSAALDRQIGPACALHFSLRSDSAPFAPPRGPPAALFPLRARLRQRRSRGQDQPSDSRLRRARQDHRPDQSSFEVAINETVQFGTLQITPRVCYSRPATEAPQTDAFAQVDEIDEQEAAQAHLFRLDVRRQPRPARHRAPDLRHLADRLQRRHDRHPRGAEAAESRGDRYRRHAGPDANVDPNAPPTQAPAPPQKAEAQARRRHGPASPARRQRPARSRRPEHDVATPAPGDAGGGGARTPEPESLHSAAYSARPKRAKSSSIWAAVMISGGQRATTSPMRG